MTAREKYVLSWLMGVTRPEDQGKDIAVPTAGECKALLIKLPLEQHRRIVAGAFGKQFQETATRMLVQFAQQAKK